MTTPTSRRQVLKASVTPLASILGSGLLIIVPVLEQTLGAFAVVGAIGVSAVAWLVGTATRHCIRVVEPLASAGTLDEATRRLERLADAVIVVAYVISVALYVRIMAQYVVGFAAGEQQALPERLVGCAAVLVIVAVAVTRGFDGLDRLDRLDRVSLSTVLLLTTVLGLTLAVVDVHNLVNGELHLPPIPDAGIGTTLLLLGGIVISVQGFETVRYLGEEYDAETRVWASRIAQGVAASMYIGFVAVATPVMGLGTSAGADQTLLNITTRVAGFLTLPLVLSAVLSQFSAAIADNRCR